MVYAGIVLSAILIAIGITGLRNALRKPVPDEVIQDELVKAIERRFPHVRIVEKRPLEVKLKNTRDEEATMRLDNLVEAARRVHSSRFRMQVYAHFLKPMEPFAAETAAPEIPLDEQLDKLMPRLIHRDALAQFPKPPLQHQIGQTPLHVALVLDEEASVRYLVDDDLAKSGMTLEHLESRAMQNLRKLWPREMVRPLIEKAATVHRIVAGDSYEATRVILLPEYLETGEVVAAAVPDRDSLLFIAPTKGTEINWELMAKLAETPHSGRVLCTRPLRVTNLGIEVR